jgi:hypothetical protein
MQPPRRSSGLGRATQDTRRDCAPRACVRSLPSAASPSHRHDKDAIQHHRRGPASAPPAPPLPHHCMQMRQQSSPDNRHAHLMVEARMGRATRVVAGRRGAALNAAGLHEARMFIEASIFFCDCGESGGGGGGDRRRTHLILLPRAPSPSCCCSDGARFQTAACVRCGYARLCGEQPCALASSFEANSTPPHLLALCPHCCSIAWPWRTTMPPC